MPQKKIAILQSNYVPWKGYFDIINSVDEFIIFDDMQFTRRDWRNRNKIVTPKGLQWMTIPVQTKGKFEQKINETKISDPAWAEKHWAILIHNYRRTEYFSKYESFFENLYLGCEDVLLSKINYRFIRGINELLGIKTAIRCSGEFNLADEKSQRLLSLCKAVSATMYLSGPAAKEYLKTELFEREGIGVEWMDYIGYKEYRQLYQKFEHGVTIIDLIFNKGPIAHRFMKSFSEFP